MNAPTKPSESIRQRFQRVILVTTAAVVAAGCAIFVFVEWRNSLILERSSALGFARITAEATADMIASGNRAEAQKFLQTLRAEPDVLAAALYDGSGSLFAEYRTPGADRPPPPHPFHDGMSTDNQRLQTIIPVTPVMQSGRRIGTLYLQTDLRDMYSRLGHYGLVALVIFLSTLLFAALLGSALEKTVSAPILALAGTAAAISRDRDWSVRASSAPGAELEALTTTFNQMLEEIQRHQTALSQEKELLATTLASIGDAVLITDRDGRITFLNREAERLTEWKDSEATGRPIVEVFRILNEQTRLPVENPVEKVSRLGQVVGLANHTILISKHDREIPIDDSAAPIRQGDGPLQGVVLIFRDFSEQKQAEEALRSAHAQLANRAVHLEDLVSLRTAKLQEAIAELQHVSYAIVHDMRAPLRAMNTFAETILEEISSVQRPSAQLLDYCHRIIIAAARLDKLIQDALNYSKVVLQDVRLRPVGLADLVRGIVQTYPNLQSERADITFEDELPVVLGEESLLTQCFSNLLGNAVKFVHPGVRPQVRIRSHVDGDTAKITIEDNGIGISLHGQTRLFGMFQRLTSEYEGTGIGLAIVRKVVERMGGRVGAESEPEKGSRFWVELRVPNEKHPADNN